MLENKDSFDGTHKQWAAFDKSVNMARNLFNKGLSLREIKNVLQQSQDLSCAGARYITRGVCHTPDVED
jgi:hypothetical protein